MATAYIASQPLAGAKAFRRVLGTLIGAVVIFVLNLITHRELLRLGIALWVGFCLYSRTACAIMLSC
jgi:uncharacterized membrane protein YccC